MFDQPAVWNPAAAARTLGLAVLVGLLALNAWRYWRARARMTDAEREEEDHEMQGW